LRAVEAAFADARLSGDFDACPHCYTSDDRAYLRNTPPLDMGVDDICGVAFSLGGTMGGVRDIAYFVPAMMRAAFRRFPIEDALVIKHLGALPPEDWTAERRDAVSAAFATYFRWRPADPVQVDLDDPRYRGWITEMLQRPPHAEPFEKPIPGWDPS
jgi:hypothetical protein